MTNQSYTPDKWKGLLAFAMVLTALFFIYDYHQILTKRPQSVHQWRQCDGASFALTYAKTGLHFFQPAAHNQHSTDGRSVAEFPIIYYIDGLLIRLFGHSDLIVRLVNLLIFYLGLFYLFRLGVLLTRNQFMALLPVVLLHSFPVAAYYATTSLPDLPAISLCFGGIYYFSYFLLNGGKRRILVALFLFSIAGMLKPTALIAFFAFGGVLILLWLKNRDSGKVKLRHLALLSLPIFLTFAYVLWGRHYNAVNNNVTFLQDIKPFWAVSEDFAYQISLRIKESWLGDYTYKPTMWLVAVLGLGSLLIPLKNGWIMKSGLVLVALGSVAYFYLFFEQFYHHDYYIIEVYPLVVAGLMIALYTLSQRKLGDVVEIPVLLAIMVILCMNINYTKTIIERRYTEDLQYHEHNDDYFDLEPKLRAIGIKRTDKVITSADNSPNISLYLMDQEGFTRFPFGMEQEQIDLYINSGAAYLIHDTDAPELLENFAPYLKEILIEHKTLQVWSLQMH